MHLFLIPYLQFSTTFMLSTPTMVEQVTCWFCVVIALLLPRLLFKPWKHGAAGATNLPPSPWQLPVISNLHQVIG